MDILKKKIILASKSPRRHQLMREAGFHFEVKTREVDESFPDDMPLEEVAPWLAEKKALACADFLETDEDILLTSDCVVIVDGQILNKPEDKEDARRMLSMLSDNMHTVVTGVCLLSKKKKRVFARSADVFFHPLTSEEIDFYIDNYQPYDKAGSYAIQEWIGLCKIKRIDGTYATIMGLPMDAVYEELVDWFRV
ncbi:MAG: septum formation protein Maf [Saprospirales bacterium]|nr:septum formation protein Maf [Saprospirales bacterium]